MPLYLFSVFSLIRLHPGSILQHRYLFTHMGNQSSAPDGAVPGQAQIPDGLTEMDTTYELK